MKPFAIQHQAIVNTAFELEQIISGKQDEVDLLINGERKIPGYKFSDDTLKKITAAKTELYYVACMVDFIAQLLETGDEAAFIEDWEKTGLDI